MPASWHSSRCSDFIQIQSCSLPAIYTCMLRHATHHTDRMVASAWEHSESCCIYNIQMLMHHVCNVPPGCAMQGLLRSAHAAAVKHHLRVNLRPLAEVQTLLWTPAAMLLLWLSWRLLVLFVRVIMLPLDDLQAAAGSAVQARS